MLSQLEREDPDKAKEILKELAPMSTERRALLRQLMRSTEIANSIAPTAWAVSLFPNGFRMNVGQVEAFVFLDGDVRLNIVGTCGMPPIVGALFVPAPYRSVPQLCCAFYGALNDFVKVQEALQQRHAEFVKLAARSPSGKPRRGTRYKSSHSDGLMAYARRQTTDA